MSNKTELAPTPEAPALIRPFFLMIKLVPMKALEDKANISPRTLLAENPIYKKPEGSYIEIFDSQFVPHSRSYINSNTNKCKTYTQMYMHLQNINKSRQNHINHIICHLIGTCGKRVCD